jgi:putative salt-induced outer membrane protein YdiY
LPEDFDWIRLSSDEWLKGEILRMYEKSLEFDSDELGELAFDLEDIKEIRSSRVVQVGFEDQPPAIGRLLMDESTARVSSGMGAVEFPRETILTLVAGQPKEINYWSFDVTVGGNIRSGNTEQVEYTARLGAHRQTVRSRLGFDYIGNITRIDSVDTSNNHRATTGWDRFVSRRLFVNLLGAEWYRDRFQNIADRYTVTAGVGYDIVDTPRTDWDATAGPAWQSTYFDSIPEDEDPSSDTPAFRISTQLEHEVTSTIDVYLGLDAFFTDTESGTYNHHLDTGVSLDLTSRTDISISWVWDRIEDPRPLEDGTLPEQDDYRLILGIEWSL